MQKAMFLLESYRKGILADVDGGLILTVNVPETQDAQRSLDPYRIEMISYSAMRSIDEHADGLRFQSFGSKTFALVEPTYYPHSHVDPTFRSSKATEHIPFRFRECEIWMSGNNRYRFILPRATVDAGDGFTIEFPRKGDVCILYFAFDANIKGVVLPYVASHLSKVIRRVATLSTTDADLFSRRFMRNVAECQPTLQR